MEVVKRKILLEDSTDRTFNSPNWGVVTATTFYMNVMLTQNMDDMGLFTDIPFVSASTLPADQPDYTILSDKLSASGITFPFMLAITPATMTGITGTTQFILRLPSETQISWYNFGNLVITGSTDSKIEDLRTYDALVPFKVGFDMDQNLYIDYNGVSLSGISRVTTLSEPNIYVFDTLNDANMGTLNQIYGLQYQDYSASTRTVTINGSRVTIPLTNFQYIGQGWNETDISLSALTKEEYLFGIISPPEVESDVFIDRGITTVMDRHLRLSEIKDLGELVRYGNGFYTITKE
jgi:hypothetical protein